MFGFLVKCPPNGRKPRQFSFTKRVIFNDPSSFRPITLESVRLKIFTSCLRNSIYAFSVKKIMWNIVFKGFTPKISGTLEHTAQMSNIINRARTKQRSFVITLLDLKYAFGKVHHNLIQDILGYHHNPEHVRSLIRVSTLVSKRLY